MTQQPISLATIVEHANLDGNPFTMERNILWESYSYTTTEYHAISTVLKLVEGVSTSQDYEVVSSDYASNSRMFYVGFGLKRHPSSDIVLVMAPENGKRAEKRQGSRQVASIYYTNELSDPNERKVKLTLECKNDPEMLPLMAGLVKMFYTSYHATKTPSET